jgi:hypothetical protein
LVVKGGCKVIIVCNANDLIGVIGVRPNGRRLSDAEKTVTLVEPLPPGHSTIAVKDEALMDAVWNSYDAGARIELVLDEQGNAVGVKPFTPIAIDAAPSPASADEIVEVTGILPHDTQDTQVTFQVEDGQAISEDVVDGQASHAYVFVSPGTYQITVSSANHGRAVAEVVVV